MSDAFDLSTLFFLAVAVIIFLRLRNVLGRRTGNERPPYDPYEAKEPTPARPDNDNRDGKVISMPGVPKIEDEPVGNADGSRDEDEEREPYWPGIAEANSPLETTLVEIAERDANFDPESFLEGAKSAYELIVTAFADGDRRVLKDLLSREVFAGFDAAITQRQKAGETVESSFVGIEKATLIEASLKNRKASVTVKFVSELISATKDADGNVIDGDPRRVREVVDIWTFMRDIGSSDPNWQLVATEAAN